MKHDVISRTRFSFAPFAKGQSAQMMQSGLPKIDPLPHLDHVVKTVSEKIVSKGQAARHNAIATQDNLSGEGVGGVVKRANIYEMLIWATRGEEAWNFHYKGEREFPGELKKRRRVMMHVTTRAVAFYMLCFETTHRGSENLTSPFYSLCKVPCPNDPSPGNTIKAFALHGLTYTKCHHKVPWGAMPGEDHWSCAATQFAIMMSCRFAEIEPSECFMSLAFMAKTDAWRWAPMFAAGTADSRLTDADLQKEFVGEELADMRRALAGLVNVPSTRAASYGTMYKTQASVFKAMGITAQDRDHHMQHFLRKIGIQYAEVFHDATAQHGMAAADHGTRQSKSFDQNYSSHWNKPKMREARGYENKPNQWDCARLHFEEFGLKKELVKLIIGYDPKGQGYDEDYCVFRGARLLLKHYHHGTLDPNFKGPAKQVARPPSHHPLRRASASAPHPKTSKPPPPSHACRVHMPRMSCSVLRLCGLQVNWRYAVPPCSGMIARTWPSSNRAEGSRAQSASRPKHSRSSPSSWVPVLPSTWKAASAC